MGKIFGIFNKAVLFLIFLSILPLVSSFENTLCVTAEVSNINPTSIGIGKEFTIGIQIENCGSEMPGFVYFELIDSPTDITIKEPLFINISNLYYGNSERFITYHMRTKEDAIPGTHLIKTRLSYGKTVSSVIKNYNITFEVIGDRAELGIASAKSKPVLPYEGETVELTLRIENAGEGTAKSVRVYADHPFQGLKQSFIGTLESEEEGPAVLTFIVDKMGEYSFPVTISYTDDFGDNEIKMNVSISVLKKPSNLRGIIFVVVLIVIIVGIIFYFIRDKRAKDKVIHQLLKEGNNSKEKTKK